MRILFAGSLARVMLPIKQGAETLPLLHAQEDMRLVP